MITSTITIEILYTKDDTTIASIIMPFYNKKFPDSRAAREWCKRRVRSTQEQRAAVKQLQQSPPAWCADP